MASLALFGFIMAVLGSFAPQAYTDLMPKRVVLQHHNMHDAEGSIFASRHGTILVTSPTLWLQNISLSSFLGRLACRLTLRSLTSCLCQPCLALPLPNAYLTVICPGNLLLLQISSNRLSEAESSKVRDFAYK